VLGSSAQDFGPKDVVAGNRGSA